MSQSQYTYNSYQSTAQSQIYNQNQNQDVAYTQQQQAFPSATQFQYSIPPQQDSVMMQMDPYHQQMNQIIVNHNQNNLTGKAHMVNEDKDVLNIMPNKQANTKLPKQKSIKKEKSKTSKGAKNNDKKKTPEEDKTSKQSLVPTTYQDDLLDLERNSGVPEFIKKLYRLLEDKSYKSIISWGDNGDSFVVKDATEFSRNVLPKHFKHNNFASFVRQLNKYDFHKVKVDKTNSYGENIWEFKHPNFQFNKKDKLELIKRKVSNKNAKLQDQNPQNSNNDIHQQVNNLIEIGSALATNLDQLASTYNDFSENYINFGKFMELQSKTLRSLVDFIIDKETSKEPNPSKNKSSFKNLVYNYNYWNLNTQVVQDSFNKFQVNVNENIEKMNNTREKINSLNDTLKNSISSVKYMDSKYSINPDDAAAIENILKSNKDKNKNNKNTTTTTTTTTTSAELTNSNLIGTKVATSNCINLFPSDNNYIPMNTTNTILINSNPNSLATTYDPKATMNLDVSSSSSPPITIKTSPPTRTVSLALQSSDLKETTSLIKSVKKPKWSQPPRVLLVEDDAICRSVSSKLLQIFGCKFDVAVDGQSAIERMGNKKYDIVLMDIIMPKVDGVTATNRIRQFDQFTPIISMTSNTTENDCITYLSNGMNDVLPKPFNKNGLLTVLERYCSHLRHMSETSMDPGFSKTIMMFGSNSTNATDHSLLGFNWNSNVETSQGRITELHDDDINNTNTSNNTTNSTNSNSLQNDNTNVATTSNINIGPVISNVNPVSVNQVHAADQVLLTMYNEKGTSSNLDSITMQNYNVSTLQPQITLNDNHNVNVQYYSSLPNQSIANATIISSHIHSPPNQLQTSTPQIIPTSTADPNLIQNQILISSNNLVLPSNQNQSTFIPNNPNSILGKRKPENDIRLINKSIIN
jgi:osomolarity two-component system response regulator SKN7